MKYIDRNVYEWHIRRVWEKRKEAEDEFKQRYWDKVLLGLRLDLNGAEWGMLRF